MLPNHWKEGLPTPLTFTEGSLHTAQVSLLSCTVEGLYWVFIHLVLLVCPTPSQHSFIGHLQDLFAGNIKNLSVHVSFNFYLKISIQYICTILEQLK